MCYPDELYPECHSIEDAPLTLLPLITRNDAYNRARYKSCEISLSIQHLRELIDIVGRAACHPPLFTLA